MAYTVFRDCSLLSCAGVVPHNRLSLIYLFTSSCYYIVHTINTIQTALSLEKKMLQTAKHTERGAIQIQKASKQADLGWQRA